MYRINEIKESLLHLVGWKQNETGWYLATHLTQSESGSYFQQEHALLTLENIKSIAPDFSSVAYPAYNPLFAYSAGSYCTYQGIGYKCILAGTDKTPTNTTYWKQVDPFSEWLENKTLDGITRCIQKYVNEKLAAKTMKSLLENRVLFDGSGRLADIITPEQKVVGLEIIPIRSKSVTLKIEKIGLQFVGQGDLTLYLMHSSRMDIVKTITCSRVRNGSMEWFPQTDLYLPYLSDENDAGGSWYLCYDQRQTTQKAVNKNFDFSKNICPTCSGQTYHSMTKYLEIHPFKNWVDIGDFNPDFNDDFSHPDLSMWDIQENEYDYQKNFGINLVVSVHCDMTDLIIEQKDAFKDVVSKTVGCILLEEIAYNPNQQINRNTMLSSQAITALNGNPLFRTSGLVAERNSAFKALDIQLRGLDRVCLPCANGGLKYGSI